MQVFQVVLRLWGAMYCGLRGEVPHPAPNNLRRLQAITNRGSQQKNQLLKKQVTNINKSTKPSQKKTWNPHGWFLEGHWKFQIPGLNVKPCSEMSVDRSCSLSKGAKFQIDPLWMVPAALGSWRPVLSATEKAGVTLWNVSNFQTLEPFGKLPFVVEN